MPGKTTIEVQVTYKKWAMPIYLFLANLLKLGLLPYKLFDKLFRFIWRHGGGKVEFGKRIEE
jgi:hypothetical protein